MRNTAHPSKEHLGLSRIDLLQVFQLNQHRINMLALKRSLARFCKHSGDKLKSQMKPTKKTMKVRRKVNKGFAVSKESSRNESVRLENEMLFRHRVRHNRAKRSAV
ncbi:hypothetical protein AVEN_275775-1 [Araneus ventricosus]|uniref:Uncharacterized protein n=1 Tax=Araneus ventricosus TaxID=182803 RepID=A0A4Y2HEQ5_ARAVE|nr:hypothetical protein AVEN_275775-1 [Araneus ventricosus]